MNYNFIALNTQYIADWKWYENASTILTRLHVNKSLRFGVSRRCCISCGILLLHREQLTGCVYADNMCSLFAPKNIEREQKLRKNLKNFSAKWGQQTPNSRKKGKVGGNGGGWLVGWLGAQWGGLSTGGWSTVYGYCCCSFTRCWCVCLPPNSWIVNPGPATQKKNK